MHCQNPQPPAPPSPSLSPSGAAAAPLPDAPAQARQPCQSTDKEDDGYVSYLNVLKGNASEDDSIVKSCSPHRGPVRKLVREGAALQEKYGIQLLAQEASMTMNTVFSLQGLGQPTGSSKRYIFDTRQYQSAQHALLKMPACFHHSFGSGPMGTLGRCEAVLETQKGPGIKGYTPDQLLVPHRPHYIEMVRRNH